MEAVRDSVAYDVTRAERILRGVDVPVRCMQTALLILPARARDGTAVDAALRDVATAAKSAAVGAPGDSLSSTVASPAVASPTGATSAFTDAQGSSSSLLLEDADVKLLQTYVEGTGRMRGVTVPNAYRLLMRAVSPPPPPHDSDAAADAPPKSNDVPSL